MLEVSLLALAPVLLLPPGFEDISLR